jgi:SAM-dependent methyltransferase
MANGTQETNWQAETLFYDKKHPRLLEMSRAIRALPHRGVLDVGCSVGTMRKLLPPEFDYYGCDITDHAGGHLEPGHFQQIDLNETLDLSYFANRGIGTVCISGVLEYIRRPDDLLRTLHHLVGPGGCLVLSMTNFEADRYSDTSVHHPAWLFKPRLDELRTHLKNQGWRVATEAGLTGDMGWRTRFYRYLLQRRGTNHPWTRRRAWYFLVTAVAQDSPPADRSQATRVQ